MENKRRKLKTDISRFLLLMNTDRYTVNQQGAINPHSIIFTHDYIIIDLYNKPIKVNYDSASGEMITAIYDKLAIALNLALGFINLKVVVK